MKNINLNNTKSHLEALLKQREEMAKKLATLDTEIKKTKKLLATKEQVLKLQKEYADKATALKKEYDAKMQALIGEGITSDSDPQPESPKPAPKAMVKETVAPKAAPVAKKVEEKKPATAPAAKAEAKPAEVPKAAAPVEKKATPTPKKVTVNATPSEKKEAAKAHNKSQFLHEIAVDNFQKVINGIAKEEAAEAILHAQIDGTKEQFAALGNAVIYGYQNGIRKFWFTYSVPEVLDAVSEEMAAILEAGEHYGFTVKVTQRNVIAPKGEAQNIAAPAASSAKVAAPKVTAAPKASQAPAKKQKVMAVNPDAFRAWTLMNAVPVDGDDAI